jgi:hypothetical protein
LESIRKIKKYRGGLEAAEVLIIKTDE